MKAIKLFIIKFQKTMPCRTTHIFREKLVLVMITAILFFSPVLLNAQQAISNELTDRYVQLEHAEKKPHKKNVQDKDNFIPDSASYARAALVAGNLLNANLEKLLILSNIDQEGTALKYFDKIITFDNEVLVGKVQHITLTEVRFLYPFNTKVEIINREKVSQILYADNRIDLFTPYDEEQKELLPVQEDRLIVYRREIWEKITITEDEYEVAGFTLLGPVSAVYDADQFKCTNEYLEKNGMIILKKRAAKLEADYILITNKSFHKGYGDPPSVKIEGLAYKID
ncbi:MAG: hypothetical protein JXB00_03585 [Bacteroidales bacterium]|nr:hypothetical protein [Bacteroidales bacterium]